MANDLEYDIIVNGKQALRTLDKVENSQKDLESTTISTNGKMNLSWVKLGASIAAVGIATALVINKGREWQKATFGMTDATKEFIRQTSILAGDLLPEQIAGFVRSAQSAGIATEEMQGLVNMAIALGRAFPQESTEVFIENLIQLNKTGEAQGFIVDILEQKYGLLDLSTLSLSEKMKTLSEVTKGVNESFQSTEAAKLDVIFNAIAVGVDKLGEGLLKLIGGTGLLDLAVDTFRDLGLIAEEANKKTEESTGFVIAKVSAFAQEIRRLKAEQLSLFKEGTISLDKYLENISKISQFQTNINGLSTQFKDLGTNVPFRELDKFEEGLKDVEKAGKTVSEELGDTFKNGFGKDLQETLLKGKFQFKDFAASIASDIASVALRRAITAPLAGALSTGLGSIFAAKGAVMTGGGQERFAQGGVVSSTTRFANGGGIMGEKGAEAIMPLTRTKTGDLGVAVTGGGAGNGTVNNSEVSITINAIDTQTGVSFLVSQKDTIAGIFNQSLTNNGTIRASL